MDITTTRLHEFQEAYKKDFGENISLDEAREMLIRVVTFYELLLQPLPESASDDIPIQELS